VGREIRSEVEGSCVGAKEEVVESYKQSRSMPHELDINRLTAYPDLRGDFRMVRIDPLDANLLG
jgi:hypothetical protein